ncbi:alpha/beta hydrolase-fold protein [Pseudoalteromonas luteoviolacea]|uniref:Uncharacterized protein n=1 Tax=Pseudoalteromonas luteoviolacea DSM 6061 TaxID=1365250 RepID=A0A162AEU3_9GAMM|nr:alpha/beta hydrolase-fold protein [Pseudoalteromonas luteoviolacea]KZN48563.1 hypothetical protein N475_05925 [Pseudoalteromonas luteoviolacea DSM 6061]MBE0388734.1 hypothetical protein [Pseudoalteromonas luteoviolacea DSM 6061]
MRYILSALSAIALSITSNAAFSCDNLEQIQSISSKVLAETRVVNIKLPNSYCSEQAKVYPVLYLLDGKENLAVESSMLDKLSRFGAVPEMIIVAIENTDRARDLAPTVNHDPRGPVGVGGGGDNFLDFIELELIPNINKSYRTHDFKVFSGASIGGLLVLHAMQSRPHLFQGHVAYSPAVWWGAQTTLSKVKAFISKQTKFENYLYINIGSEPAPMRDYYDELATHLSLHKPTGFELVANTFNDVPHAMTSAAGSFNAYSNLFLPLNMPNSALTEGVKSIKQYYERVSEQRGKKTVAQEWVLRELGYGLVNNKDFTQAIEVFKYNIEQYPNMASAYNGLAYAFEQNKQFKQSLEQVNIALKLAKKGDEGYEVYQNRKRRLVAAINSKQNML